MKIANATYYLKGKRLYLNYDGSDQYGTNSFVSLVFMNGVQVPYREEGFDYLSGAKSVDELIEGYELSREYVRFFDGIGGTVPETVVGFAICTDDKRSDMTLNTNLYLHSDIIGTLFVPTEDGQLTYTSAKNLHEKSGINEKSFNAPCHIESVEVYETKEELYAALHATCNELNRNARGRI